MRKPDKHLQIFERFNALAVGESLALINNHDPKHLCGEFATDHPGEFSWSIYRQAWAVGDPDNQARLHTAASDPVRHPRDRDRPARPGLQAP